MVVEYLAAINHSIELVKRLREVSKNIKEAEIKSILAELYNELSDVKIQMAGLKEQVADLKEENLKLKTAQPGNKQIAKFINGAYQFEGEEGEFCTGCFDSSGKKIRITKFLENVYTCSVCNNLFERR